MLELPKPPWYHRVWVLYLAILVVVVLVLAAATVTLGAREQQAASPTTLTGASPVTPEGDAADPTSPPTAPASRTTARAAAGVLWQKTGSDVHHGHPFVAPARWRLVWSFDCRNFAGHGGGNFKVYGEGRLVVESVCQRWIVKAVAP